MRVSKILVGAVTVLSLGAGGPEMQSEEVGTPNLQSTSKFLRSEQAVRGQYIVVLQDDASNVR